MVHIKKKNLKKKKKKQNTADTPKCPINPTQGLLNYTSILSQEVSVLMTFIITINWIFLIIILSMYATLNKIDFESTRIYKNGHISYLFY